MKYIVKGSEPQSFTQWKQGAVKEYTTLRNPVKANLKQTLIEEQGHICCYCERRLVNDDCHIEHLIPQNEPTVDNLDFSNMLCSCQKTLRRGEPRHCGNSKDNNILQITPLQKNCAEKFNYTADGYIEGIDKDSRDTIEILNLSIDKLNNLRNSAIEPFLSKELSIEEVQTFVNSYLRKTNGQYNEFYTTIQHLFP